MDEKNTNIAYSEKVVRIKNKDLPLCCPLSNEKLWDRHPRVYLPIEQTHEKKITCPYCSATYILDDHE